MKLINPTFLFNLFFLFIITTINLSAQIDTTRKEFYPLQVGNLWQYQTSSNQLYTAKISVDTLIDGEQYFIFESVGLRTQSGIMRVDSLMRVELYGGTTGGDPCIIYKLFEIDSTVWEPCYAFSGHLGDQLIRFNNITIINIFGQPREVMNFDYGGVVQGEDTVWAYGASLVEGIGVLEEQYFDGDYRILQGAIIKGIQYGTIVSVDEIVKTIPDGIILHQNYPNPFNPTTKIRYEILQTTGVKLKIINILGEEVTVLVNEVKYPGSYEVEFNASQLSSGMYIALLQTTEAQLSGSMLLIK